MMAKILLLEDNFNEYKWSTGRLKEKLTHSRKERHTTTKENFVQNYR